MKKKRIKIFSCMLAAALVFNEGFFAYGTEELVRYDIIRSNYWGNYYCTSNDTYLIAITGETDVTFRGEQWGKKLACTGSYNIYFSPAKENTRENFMVDFSSYAVVKPGTDYYTPQPGTYTLVGWYADGGFHIYSNSGKTEIDDYYL